MDVQAAVVRWLAGNGWFVVRAGGSGRPGARADIVAERGGRRLLVEVPSWPPGWGDQGEPDPRAPAVRGAPGAAVVQSLAAGLVALIRSRTADPDADLALAVPDRRRHRAVLADLRWALDRLEVAVFLVDPGGTVRRW